MTNKIETLKNLIAAAADDIFTLSDSHEKDIFIKIYIRDVDSNNKRRQPKNPDALYALTRWIFDNDESDENAWLENDPWIYIIDGFKIEMQFIGIM